MGLGAFAKADSHRASPEVRKLRSGGVEAGTALVADRAGRLVSAFRCVVLVCFLAGSSARPPVASQRLPVEARLRRAATPNCCYSRRC